MRGMKLSFYCFLCFLELCHQTSKEASRLVSDQLSKLIFGHNGAAQGIGNGLDHNPIRLISVSLSLFYYYCLFVVGKVSC